MLVSTVLALQWWVQYVTSVKLGFVMGGNVSVRTPVPALSLTLSVWSANEASGTTEAEYSVVRFAITFSVKMISLNIKPAARF